MCVCTFYWERQLYKIYDNTAYTTQIIYDIIYICMIRMIYIVLKYYAYFITYFLNLLQMRCILRT